MVPQYNAVHTDQVGLDESYIGPQKVNIGPREVKTEDWKFQNVKKSSFGPQNEAFETIPKTKMISKYTPDNSDTIPAQYSYIKQLF